MNKDDKKESWLDKINFDAVEFEPDENFDLSQVAWSGEGIVTEDFKGGKAPEKDEEKKEGPELNWS